MKVTFDDEGYLEFLSTTGDLPNSIELPDDDSLNYKYLNCYRLNEEKSGLILDAAKVQVVEQNLTAAGKIAELKRQITKTDYKVLRKIREDALGIKHSMTKDDYLLLEAERESIVRQIRELEDGVLTTTDPTAILNEGQENRSTKEGIATFVEELKNQVEEQSKVMSAAVEDSKTEDSVATTVETKTSKKSK